MTDIQVTPNGSQPGTVTLHEAARNALPGDRLLLAAGPYNCSTPVRFEGIGSDNDYLEVVADPDVVLDGCVANPVGPQHLGGPLESEHACIQIIDCRRLRMSGFRIENAWPTGVYIQDSRNLAFQQINVTGGTYAFFARGLKDPNQTREMDFEKIVWTQDPEEHMGSGRVSWAQIKDQTKPGIKTYTHFNGGMFASNSIRGHVRIRRCEINHRVGYLAHQPDYAANC